MTFSIVICTRNRAGLLRSCLESIEALETPADASWEVVVCDNGGTDATRAVTETFAARLSLRYLYVERQGKCYALAHAVAEASGEWLLFLDDDVRVEPSWLAAYRGGIGRHPEASFFGGQVLCSPDTPLSGVNAWLLPRAPAVFGIVAAPAECRIDLASKAHAAGANSAFRRSALLDADAPRRLLHLARNNILGEDTWLMLDQLHRGNGGWFLTDAVVTHHIPLERAGLLWFWNWHVARGRAARRLTPVRDEFDMFAWVAHSRRRAFWRALRQRHFGRFFLLILSNSAMRYGRLTASRTA